jgi:hypothetical protein
MPNETAPVIESTRGGEHIPIQPSVRFEQLHALPKTLSDDFILKCLNNELRIQTGDSPMSVYEFMTHVPADESDKGFVRDPEKLADFHAALVDFITTKLSLHTRNLNVNQERDLEGIKQEFFSRLAAGNSDVSDFVTRWISWTGEGKRPRMPIYTYQFHGLNLPTNKGDIDLLSRSTRQVRSNLFMQREMTGQYLHWESSSYTDNHMDEDDMEMSKRIYLNPRLEDTVKIFGQITDLIDEAGLGAGGKILDRGYEALMVRRGQEQFNIRGEGIVLYAGDDADALLGIVEHVFKNNRASFDGRSVSALPRKITDGIAVGSEPGIEGESLISHRSKILEEARMLTREAVSVMPLDKVPSNKQSQAIALYKEILRQLSREQGVSSHSLAFNAR